MAHKQTAIDIGLKNAEDWEKKGQPIWVNRCLSSVLLNQLSLVVGSQSDSDSAVAALRKHAAEALLQRMSRNLQLIVSEIDAGRLSASVIGGNYLLLVYTHLAWALGEVRLGESFAVIARRPEIAALSTAFWREYAAALELLTTMTPYTAKKLRLKGQEEYWFGYLKLVEALTEPRDPTVELAALDALFARRNASKKIADDADETEGSGNYPALWDYRRDSILNYVAVCRSGSVP